MEKTDEIVFGIVKSLYAWENDYTNMPADVTHYQNRLVKLMIDNESNQFPNNLNEFIKLLYKPINEWGINHASILEKMSEKSILTIYGTLNPDFVEWMNEIHSIEDVEQKYMFDFLLNCRNLFKKTNDPIYIEYYRRGRSFICPENAIIEKLDLEEFLDEFPDELKKNLRNLYKALDTTKDKVFLCPICGYLVNFDNKKEGLCKSELCKEFKRDQEPKILNLNNKKYYILTKGAYQFILLPSISENKIYKSLKQKYKEFCIELYPEIDLYDIRISYGEKVVDLDVKDHKSPVKLVESIIQNSNIEKLNTSHPVFLVIPNHRKALNQAYKENVLAELKIRDVHVKVIYEYELDKQINKFLSIGSR